MALLKVARRTPEFEGASALRAEGAVDPSGLLGGVLDSALVQITSPPWLGPLLVLLVGSAAVRRLRAAVHGRPGRDSQRRFRRSESEWSSSAPGTPASTSPG